MRNEKIKAVVWDWGNTLIDDPEPVLVAYCSRLLGTSQDDFRRVFENHRYAFDVGDISERTFWKKMTDDLRVAMPQVPSLWGPGVYPGALSAKTNTGSFKETKL